jgi:hypothetical protein
MLGYIAPYTRSGGDIGADGLALHATAFRPTVLVVVDGEQLGYGPLAVEPEDGSDDGLVRAAEAAVGPVRQVHPCALAVVAGHVDPQPHRSLRSTGLVAVAVGGRLQRHGSRAALTRRGLADQDHFRRMTLSVDVAVRDHHDMRGQPRRAGLRRRLRL